MRSFFRALLLVLLCFFSACDHKESTDILNVSFRLYDSETEQLLSDTLVSIYDGFDKRLPPFAGPVRSDNAPYHFADVVISPNGILSLDLSKFKENDILITAGKLYKYIYHEENTVRVIHYKREEFSLHVTAHYNYNLETKLLEIKRLEESEDAKKISYISEEPKNFSYINVPMD